MIKYNGITIFIGLSIVFSLLGMDSPKKHIHLPPNFLETDDVILNNNKKMILPARLAQELKQHTITLHKIPYPIATAIIDRKNRKGSYKKIKHVRSKQQLHKIPSRIKKSKIDHLLYFDKLLQDQDAHNFRNPLYSGHALITKILQFVAWNHPSITLSCTFYEFAKVLNKMPKPLQIKIERSVKKKRCTFKKKKRYRNEKSCCSTDQYIDYLDFLFKKEKKMEKQKANNRKKRD